MNITGYINNPLSAIQPLNASVSMLAGSSLGLGSKNIVRILIEHLGILRSVRINTIHLTSATYGFNEQFSGNKALKLVNEANNSLYFETPYPSTTYEASNFTLRVTYEVSAEDITLLRYIAERTTAKILNQGCKIVIPSASNLDYPSFIQNLGTSDNTLLFTDCYGNDGTLTLKPGEATYFLVSVVRVGSGSPLYQLYSK